MKKVLIAHQSTIPHYRVAFYNALERLRPDNWRFDVAFDPSELTSPRFFKEPLRREDIHFSVLEINTLMIKVFDKKISYQTFWSRAGQYDLVIVENALNNITYPLSQMHQLRGVKFAYWGHGKDREIESPKGLKWVGEKLKLKLVRRADGYFAYTMGVKKYLEMQGISGSKIYVVNNTIDIDEQRRAFNRWYPQRRMIRQDLGVEDKKVLLFVGRFTPNKRLDFLLEAFSCLRNIDTNFILLLVGDGEIRTTASDGISVLGSIINLDRLAPIYVASDIFTFPGSVGLASLQALCYDLPVVTIDSLQHKPEIEYLSAKNSLILSKYSTPQDYAQAVLDLCNTPSHLESLRRNAWPSIRHLTIDKMAERFITGIEDILQKSTITVS